MKSKRIAASFTSMLIFLVSSISICFADSWQETTNSDFSIGTSSYVSVIGDSVTLQKEWVDTDGTGQESINISNNTGDSLRPFISIDNSGYLHVAWSDNTTGNSEIYYLKWNDSEWVDADGSGGDSINVSNDADTSSYPTLRIDSTGNPHIIWQNYISDLNEYQVYYLKWNGSKWVDADGSGRESIDISSGISKWVSTPILFLDSSDNPHVVWSGRVNDWEPYQIYYLKWNGSEWVDADGTGQESVNIFNNSRSSEKPSLYLDSSGHPGIAWENSTSSIYDEIFYLKWNGSEWVDADGSGQESVNVSSNSTGSNTPSLYMDSSGKPHIAWEESPPFPGGCEIYYLKWDGSSWVDADGSGQESINISNSETAYNPVIRLNYFDNPSIVWTDNSLGQVEVYYLKWNGSEWVDADGTGRESINISNSNGTSVSLSFCLEFSGNLHIAWDDNSLGNREIYYLKWAGSNSGNYISASKNLGAKVSWDTISWTAEEPGGTEITFNTRTSDDGTTWSSWSSSYTTSGSAITSASAQYIQVRANFSTSVSSQTPVLYDFTVTYDYVDVSSPVEPGAVSDGLSTDSDVTFSQTQLSANWTAGSDAESGIKGYWYAVGTSSGGVDVSSWTYADNVTSIIVTGLTLTVGDTYYFLVKAENNAGLKSAPVSSDGIRVGATELDHYEVSAPTAVVTGSLFTVTIYAKNDTGDTINYNTSVTLQAMLSSEPSQAGSGILGVPAAGISNGVGTVTHQTYTKAEDIKIKATDGLDNTGLSNTIHMISSYQAALSISVNPSSILTGQTAQITVVLKDYYGNPISGGDVSFNVTQGAGTVSPSYGTTDASGEIKATFTPDANGAGSVIIYATSGDLTPVSGEIEVSELITTAGGTIVASNDSATKLVIPAGAVSANALMNFTAVNPETNQAVSYDLSAREQTTGQKITDFNVPVTLTLHYNVVGGKVYNTNVDASDAANNIALFYHDGVQWQKIGGTVDTGFQTVTADVTHLSKYAIMASAKPKAFSMKGIGPNPFTPNPDGEYDRVHFYFDNPDNLPVTIRIYNIGGNLIKTITGTPGVVPYWNGTSDSGRLVEGGVYIYYLMVGNNRAKGTVVLAK
ncbi:MAG: Ig-like domain-containing protein [bacterium]